MNLSIILLIIGWILWVVCLWFAFGHAWGIIKYTKEKETFQQGTAITSFLLMLFAAIFLSIKINKLHLIWILPLSFFAPPYIVLYGYAVSKILSPIYWVLMLPTRLYVFILTFWIRNKRPRTIK